MVVRVSNFIGWVNDYQLWNKLIKEAGVAEFYFESL